MSRLFCAVLMFNMDRTSPMYTSIARICVIVLAMTLLCCAVSGESVRGIHRHNHRGKPHTNRIPNIVHFIWFDTKDKREFGFVNYLSVLSAYRIQKPDQIMFHCDRAPTVDKWWTQLSREVPLSHFRVYIQSQMMSHTGQNIDHPEHIIDILRLQVLHKYGGIYIDLDAIVINSLNPLRHYPAVIGQEIDEQFNCGCVMSEPSGTLVTSWLKSYRYDYNNDDKTYNSKGVPYQLYLDHPGIVHVEKTTLTSPDINHRELLTDGLIDWRGLYIVHLQHEGNYTPETIENNHYTVGEVLSYAYNLRHKV